MFYIGVWKRHRYKRFRLISSKHVLAGTLALTNQLLAEELRQHGARLMIAVEVPYLLTIPRIVATSDFIACVPSELAELFSHTVNIEVFELPAELPDLTVKQFWHARFHDDIAYKWFRNLVADTLGNE